ncbi:MAG: glycosyltransferase family 2 protein [Chlamydiota bacterium]|nr:glycosyltransferase family 2 protein [Chlamydiota bacterium]
MKKNYCSVIIITHNSEKFIGKAIESLKNQTRNPDQILIIDTGSEDLSYIYPHVQEENISLIFGGKEIGFCKGNNIGMKHVSKEAEYILLLNPDAFLFPEFIEKSIAYMNDPKNSNCGMVTGKVYGYDIDKDTPTYKYDTTGIFQKWYGKWYDRGQGEECSKSLYNREEHVPAICGALMFCRKIALTDVLINDREIFDSSFFMYKEDIDLSLRLRKKGWSLKYMPTLEAYHCRGWNPNRQNVSKYLRIHSAKNELKIHLKSYSPIPSIYSLAKYLAVSIFNY